MSNALPTYSLLFSSTVRLWRCVARRWPWRWLCVGRVWSLLSPAPTLEVSLTLAMCWRRRAPHRSSRSVHSMLMIKGQQGEAHLVGVEDIFCVLTIDVHWLPWCFRGDCRLETEIKPCFAFSCRTAQQWQWVSGCSWPASVPPGLRVKLKGWPYCWVVTQTLGPSLLWVRFH